jgi:23S rRNA pseudouridine2604 synthase
MCEHYQYRVKALRRVRVMNIKLGDMKPGELRSVSEQELSKLRSLLKQ